MRRLLLPLTLAVALLLSACSGSDEPAEADVAFAQQMIPHHEQAVEMSAMVDGAQASPEVEDLAARIAGAQGPEIETMTGWLEEWDVDPDGSMGSMGSMEGMMSDDQMAQLDRSSGADFDRRWLTMMIAHHRGAVAMAETVLDEGEDPEVRELAQEIIDGQRAEITEMEAMLDE